MKAKIKCKRLKVRVLSYSSPLGFTLVELLVVISIIAMLLSILVPSLSAARRKARKVVCQSNVKQWGVMLVLYTGDNDSRFFPGPSGKVPPPSDPWDTGDVWAIELEPYYFGDSKIRLCPEAIKGEPMDVENNPFTLDYLGKTHRAGTWMARWNSTKWIKGGDLYSYGMNWWTADPELGVGSTVGEGGLRQSYFWRTMNNKGADEIPLFGDCAWVVVAPANNGATYSDTRFVTPPGLPDQFGVNWGIELCCMDRHGGGTINMCFIDSSVRSVGLKELWTLKWHRNFDTRIGPPAGKWPEWMRKFKNY